MNWEKELYPVGEQPLDRFPSGISQTAIFRTIGFVGDSLSSGEFESCDSDGNRSYHDYYEYSWGQYLARKNGLTAYNFSRGGMTTKEYIESFADANRFWRPEVACQAYVIALGVNDLSWANIPLGAAADVNPENWRGNAKTFAGYYGAIVSRLKEIQPRAKFFFVTIPREGNAEDEKRLAHARLLHALAEVFDNSYVIDLHQYGPVYDDHFKERFFLYGHMNASGYIFTANLVDAYIDYLVRHNPDDFRRVPYIGTELK